MSSQSPVDPNSASSPSRPSTPTPQNHHSNPFSPSPRKRPRQYGDRYIPNRQGVNLQAAFSLLDTDPTLGSGSRPCHNELDFQTKQDANRMFSTLLKSELLGTDISQQASTANANNTLGRSTMSATTPPPSPPLSYSQPPSTPKRHHSRNPSASSSSSMFTYLSSPRSKKTHRSELDSHNDMYSLSPIRAESQRLLLSPQKPTRPIVKSAYRVLDAPELVDDFYLNLVDWGSSNLLGVGLASCVYLWNPTSSKVTKLCDLGERQLVTSVSWIQRGSHLAVGSSSGQVQIWDVERNKRLRTMSGHSQRAGCLSWNEHILSSGSRDRTILHRDVRIPAHFTKRLVGHKQEVCGLKWNSQENMLASGSNDNRLLVWDGMNDSAPVYKFTQHVAAVKAISWSPHQRGILASGGGTADRKIRIFNTHTGHQINHIDTGSQICNLAWSKTSNEIVSTHGYSQNKIVVWKYPSLRQVAALTGHTYRVLYLSMSPDGESIVTGAGDETLRFWNVFGSGKDPYSMSSLLEVGHQIR